MTENRDTLDEFEDAPGWRIPLLMERLLADRQLPAVLAEWERHHLGTAVLLWHEALLQKPMGTLPSDDVELASLARVPDFDFWQNNKAHILSGWLPVSEVGGDEGSPKRLRHPVIDRWLREERRRRRLWEKWST